MKCVICMSVQLNILCLICTNRQYSQNCIEFDCIWLYLFRMKIEQNSCVIVKFNAILISETVRLYSRSRSKTIQETWWSYCHRFEVGAWCVVKSTFHYSIKLQTWLSTRFAARFSTSSCGFATCFQHAFDFFLSKTWSRTCCIKLDVRSSLGFKQVCSWLSTCYRHAFDLLASAFDTLTQVESQVCSQVCSLLE